MAITRVKVRNFKSFGELDVELRPLNIVVGGNATGKSNFLEIFRFVGARAVYGMEDAVSLHGGMEFLPNLGSGASDSVELELACDKIRTRRRMFGLGFVYSVVLKREGTGAGFGAEEKILRGLRGRSPALRDMMLRHQFSGIKSFDLDPRLPKKAVPISGRAELEPDGSNLAIVLRAILQDEESRATFVRLLQDALPFVEDLKVERFADKSLLIALKEGFSERTYLPAAFLSDGTLHLIALIVALYFDKSEVTIIEEPERNIHPHLISKVAAMLKDASRQKQVIVTTHNPELVKHADLEDLLLVQRDERGFSRITRPAEDEQLKVFLENDLGVDELYVQDLLGVGHGV